MANILVYIELDGDRPLPASLAALALGRRIASTLGATNYALLPCAARPSYGDDDAIAVLSRHGADKVLLATHAKLAGPPLSVTHGPVVVAACTALPPTLVLFASTAGARDIAPRLAAQLAAAYLAEPHVSLEPDGSLVLTRATHGGRTLRRLRAQDLERPLVLTLDPGQPPRPTGDEEAEVVVLPPTGAGDGFEELERHAETAPSLASARVVVGAGAGLGPEAYGVAHDLAAALGGEAGLTREAAQGAGPSTRIIDATGQRISPRLYIACAASGSFSHLGGVGAETMVAINRDDKAPIFEVARYGLVADAREAAAAIRGALERRG
ncbi:MAG TPA: FAD-binding protein [Polyangia bacterium]